MSFISILLLIFLIVSAVLLILAVLIQDEQGEGVGGLFSGGSSTPFGSRSGNILTKFTTVIAVIFLVSTFGLAWVNRNPEVGNVIGKARAETLQTSQNTDWWVPSGEKKEATSAPAPSSSPDAQTAPQPVTQPAAEPEKK